MYILDVYIQHKKLQLNKPFTYVYDGVAKVSVGMRVNVNFNNQKIVGYITKVRETDKTLEEISKDLGFNVKEIDSLIDESPILSEKLTTLAKQVASYYYVPFISVLQAILPPSLRPQRSYVHRPKIKTRDIVVPLTNDTTGLTKRQKEVLISLNDYGYMLKSDIGPTIFKKLLELNKIAVKEKEVYRSEQIEEDVSINFTLTSDQQKAVDYINSTNYETYLLQGVTGSGKTEVYYTLAKQVIEEGRQVLFLIPEIILTNQMVRYFKKRFPFNIAILHSGLTDAEKYDEYRRISNEKVDVVIGARSAIFAPLDNVGLIIVDEEHSETYKQDFSPFYDARTVAIMRAKMENAYVVFGSATPTIETKYKAENNVYGYFNLPKRINEKDLPKTSIVDISDASNLTSESPFISKQLKSALEDCLAKNEQALLLVTKKGYAPFTVCRNCGYLFRCPKCNTPLTYHSHKNKLECHHCGYFMYKPKKCPKCNSRYLQMSGFGTERIVEDIRRMFPDKLILRIDSETISSSKENSKMVNLFAEGYGDIMIGTQMIAKGHDFPNVTLTAIVNPDITLALPYFRTSEKLFSLITQCVGRGGRASKVGSAIIQTSYVNNPIIKLAATQDYEAFYKLELQNRRILSLPPFTNLISLTILGPTENETDRAILGIKKILNLKLKDEIKIIGPARDYAPYFSKNVAKRIIIKHDNYFKLKPVLLNLITRINTNPKYSVVINVDPLDI